MASLDRKLPHIIQSKIGECKLPAVMNVKFKYVSVYSFKFRFLSTGSIRVFLLSHLWVFSNFQKNSSMKF